MTVEASEGSSRCSSIRTRVEGGWQCFHLPPPATQMLSDIGYVSRIGIVLNVCCVKCRVSVSVEFLEFDSLPHACHGMMRESKKPRTGSKPVQQEIGLDSPP
jgi:hypothetical protein